MAQGGKFIHGFLSGAVGSLGGSATKNVNDKVARVAIAAAMGGTAEQLGGGKFANGAVTGAFVVMFNDLEHDKINLSDSKNPYKDMIEVLRDFSLKDPNDPEPRILDLFDEGGISGSDYALGFRTASGDVNYADYEISYFIRFKDNLQFNKVYIHTETHEDTPVYYEIGIKSYRTQGLSGDPFEPHIIHFKYKINDYQHVQDIWSYINGNTSKFPR